MIYHVSPKIIQEDLYSTVHDNYDVSQVAFLTFL
jgi:hypothetical protein